MPLMVPVKQKSSTSSHHVHMTLAFSVSSMGSGPTWSEGAGKAKIARGASCTRGDGVCGSRGVSDFSLSASHKECLSSWCPHQHKNQHFDKLPLFYLLTLTTWESAQHRRLAPSTCLLNQRLGYWNTYLETNAMTNKIVCCSAYVLKHTYCQ